MIDMKEFEQEIIKELVSTYGNDLYDIFGKDLNEMLNTAYQNYAKDFKTKWEDVECVQSTDFMSVVVKTLLRIRKEEE